jgi:hypothetical protein
MGKNLQKDQINRKRENFFSFYLIYYLTSYLHVQSTLEAITNPQLVLSALSGTLVCLSLDMNLPASF